MNEQKLEQTLKDYVGGKLTESGALKGLLEATGVANVGSGQTTNGGGKEKKKEDEEEDEEESLFECSNCGKSFSVGEGEATKGLNCPFCESDEVKEVKPK